MSGEAWGRIWDGLKVCGGVCWEREDAEFQREGGGEFCWLSRSLWCSLSVGKRWGRSGEGAGFNRRLEWVLGASCGFKFHRHGELQLMAATGEATRINAAEEEDGKAERG